MATLEFKTEDGNSQIFDRVMEGRVQVFHGPLDSIGEVRLVPNMQFVVRIPFDAFVEITKWALAPAGKGRFADVKLKLSDRSRTISHEWNLKKAFVYRFEEVEFPATEHNATSQENIMEVVIRGILANGEDYDGKNILTMTSNSGGSTA